jgi:hypothetical protein
MFDANMVRVYGLRQDTVVLMKAFFSLSEIFCPQNWGQEKCGTGVPELVHAVWVKYSLMKLLDIGMRSLPCRKQCLVKAAFHGKACQKIAPHDEPRHTDRVQ